MSNPKSHIITAQRCCPIPAVYFCSFPNVTAQFKQSNLSLDKKKKQLWSPVHNGVQHVSTATSPWSNSHCLILTARSPGSAPYSSNCNSYHFLANGNLIGLITSVYFLTLLSAHVEFESLMPQPSVAGNPMKSNWLCYLGRRDGITLSSDINQSLPLHVYLTPFTKCV